LSVLCGRVTLTNTLFLM